MVTPLIVLHLSASCGLKVFQRNGQILVTCWSNHLMFSHGTEYREIKQSESKADSFRSSMPRRKDRKGASKLLQAMFRKPEYLVQIRKSMIDLHEVTNFVYTSLHVYTVDKQGFRNMISVIEPQCQLPHKDNFKFQLWIRTADRVCCQQEWSFLELQISGVPQSHIQSIMLTWIGICKPTVTSTLDARRSHRCAAPGCKWNCTNGNSLP